MTPILKSSLNLLIILSTLNIHVFADCNPPDLEEDTWIQYPEGVNGRQPIPERTMLTVKCNPGFAPVYGDSIIMCLNSKWRPLSRQKRSVVPLLCEEKSCPVKEPQNGSVELRGAVVLYSCNRGFRLKGAKRATCRVDEETGEYYVSKKPPVCDRIKTCKKPEQEELESLHIKLDYSSKQCESYGCEIGTKMVYVCEDRYEMVNESYNSRECKKGGNWTGKFPTCKPNGIPTCPEPPLEENNLEVLDEIRSHPEIFLQDDEIYLECKKFHKTNSSLDILCDNGTWLDEIPICLPMDSCPRPRIPKNGRIIEIVDDETKKFPFGFEINFECNENHEIRSKQYGTQCIGDDWKHPIPDCVPIECSDPGNPENAMRTLTGLKVGDTVKYSCQNSLQLHGDPERTCEKNGRWSGYTTVCDNGETKCLNPGIPVNSYRSGHDFNLGNIVQYSCNKGFTLLGNGTRECLENGCWSGEEIECVGKNEYTHEYTVIDSLTDVLTTAARSVANTDVTYGNGRTLSNSGSVGVSILFVLDVSGSINDHQLNQMKNFTKLIIRRVGISEETQGIRMGLITFATKADTVFTTKVNKVDVATNMVDRIKRHEAGGTNLKVALQELYGLRNVDRHKDFRPNSRAVAFLVTDGLFTDGGEPTYEADVLRTQYKIDIYSISIGSNPNKNLLHKISNQTFSFTSYDKLLEIVNNAIDRRIDFSACGMERPQAINDTGINNGRFKRNLRSNVRIIGGTKVYRAWPWMAALKLDPVPEDKSHVNHMIGVLCGGFIIHKQWILTAAHCFFNEKYSIERVVSKVENWKVLLGRTNIRSESGLEFPVKNIIIHPNYVKGIHDYDVALIQLPKELIYDDFMRPICLPPVYSDLVNMKTGLYQDQSIATVIGWGHAEGYSVNSTNVETKAVDHLNELELPLQNSTTCHKEFTYKICGRACRDIVSKPMERMICAGDGLGGRDSCQGDSGGPLMQKVKTKSGNNTVERWFAIGTVSWGIGCAQEGFYGYYMNVAKMRPWIENATKEKFETNTLVS